ncbi:HAD family hydrolase [Nocardia farcinica]|uniref:Phosphatase YniC n=1 Tax=Nocardia farcinica TaxID=37329 RepID=A0A0H5NKH2_NOCFR|nr:HAD family phosphatase [Nocardia farcinica]AXK85017.1 HAD family phosphatase [Nocardia farcinica]MBA4855411.1 HAD family phosphatase [Nocardia farcinica]MBC9818250.1 HAD family phosphatase [Nocardia farcinica]MBF6067702.1 HAD family phosphatase [Nocardia farcinica]MBF6441580.1 HAD family phosphatase [Nocardia farcinica]
MQITAVVFDMDGVLIDSEPVWERVRRAYIADHGGTWQPDTQRRLMGMSTGEWSAYLSRELGVDAPPDRVAAEVIALMSQHYDRAVPLLPGAVEAVRRMSENFPLGLASSSPRALIDTVLGRTGLIEHFTVTLSTEEVARGKPAPDVYLAVADKLGVAPQACAAVEDSSNGLRSAHAAGMRVIAVPRPEYPLDPDARALASALVTDPTALTPALVAGG